MARRRPRRRHRRHRHLRARNRTSKCRARPSRERPFVGNGRPFWVRVNLFLLIRIVKDDYRCDRKVSEWQIPVERRSAERLLGRVSVRLKLLLWRLCHSTIRQLGQLRPVKRVNAYTSLGMYGCHIIILVVPISCKHDLKKWTIFLCYIKITFVKCTYIFLRN